MKNITKYILAAAAAFSSLTACQEFEDFDKTIDGTPGLVYVQTGTENLYTIRVVHKPTGSTGEFFTEFPVRCNTTRHAGVKATFVYDASLVESYNAEHKTSYAALPAEYLTLENTTLTVPENATASADSVKVTLTGNLSLLTERNYLAPLRIKAEGIDASEVMGAVYVAVATEINLIRAIESTDDMVGFTATGRSAWTADCGNYANLFDGSTSTSVDFPEQYGNVLNIDMKEPQLVTGLCLGYGSVPSVSIEYSADGETFSQAGTPVSGEYVTSGSRMYAAFYGHIEARYLRLTIGFSSSWSKTLSDQRRERFVQRICDGSFDERLHGVGRSRQLAGRRLQHGPRHFVRGAFSRIPATGQQHADDRRRGLQIRRRSDGFAQGRPDTAG